MKTTLQRIHKTTTTATTAIGLLLAVVPFAANGQKLDDRVTRIERLLESGALTDMANQQEQLRRALQDLQGEVELIRRDLTELRQRQHDLYLDTDRRLQQLETRSPQSLPDQATPGGTNATSAPGPADELAEYQKAFASLKAGRYAEATAGFQAFLQNYPQGEYAANALYWLGESHYVVRDFPNALTYFQRVLSEHPASSKSPDALLKIGFVHHEQGNIAEARRVLEKVKAEYPNTSAAALAEQRLRRLPAR